MFPPTDFKRIAFFYRPAAAAGLALLFLAQSGLSQTLREPGLVIAVDQAILRFDPDHPDTAKTMLSVLPSAFPAGDALTYTWQQVQDEMLPGAARMTEKPIRFSATNQASVAAAFPASGVYEVRVTVSDSARQLTLSRNTWINVWDSRPALINGGQPDPLSVIPGMAPPKVRNVASEPGPFVHPRLFCSPEDWADIHARAVEGKSKIAAAGWKSLKDYAKRGVDPNSNHGKFLAQVERYADAGFTGTAPDLMMGWNDKNGIERAISGLFESLAQASFAQWLKNDPATPESALPPEDRQLRQKVAKQIAGFCRFFLDNSWDRATGQFKKDALGYIKNLEIPGERTPDSFSQLALAYDFAAPWMSEDQRRDVRNLLIAIGRGRSGPGFDVGRPLPKNHLARRGPDQNGTFGVWGEPMILLSLVVAGEESAADPLVVKTFLNPPKPPNYEKLNLVTGYDLTQSAEVDGSRPFPSAIIWPHARKSDVAWLQKEVFTFQDVMISPWGFTLERLAYFGYMANEAWPCAYVFARYGGFNQFVGCHYYQSVNNWIYTMYPSGGTNAAESFTNQIGIYEHHSGGGDYRQQWILFLKHMYPEDPVVDYAYAAQAPDLERRVLNRITTCLFGVDPKLARLPNALEPIARARQLPLTKLDPQMGIAVMRSGWRDDDLMLYLDGGHPVWGHMNAEHGSFGLFALGRHWSVPSGYHKVLGNFQSLIQVQNPAWRDCPVTQGYMTENPCFKPQVPGCDYEGFFPTPSAHLLEVREAPDQSWSLAATDITICYNFTCGKPATNAVHFDPRTWMYPGLLTFQKTIDPEYGNYFSQAWFNPVPAGCRIEQAVRTALFVRGPHPFVLVVDDFRKGAAPANYRWVMNDKIKMKDEGRAAGNQDESFCLRLAPEASPTEAVLYHERDKASRPDETGLPRLLIRDVSENKNRHQPAIRMEYQIFKLPEEKYSREENNALVIERNQVVDPSYKVLLFPFRTGEKLPVTTWNWGKTELTIKFADGTRKTICFDRTNPDHRTRLQCQ